MGHLGFEQQDLDFPAPKRFLHPCPVRVARVLPGCQPGATGSRAGARGACRVGRTCDAGGRQNSAPEIASDDARVFGMATLFADRRAAFANTGQSGSVEGSLHMAGGEVHAGPAER
ncbi:hypothetical protein J1614_009288 [Plenodomus biglobosus]|nr:hypothetical protein J1614_009288 [Plenodomus biglobosus]